MNSVCSWISYVPGIHEPKTRAGCVVQICTIPMKRTVFKGILLSRLSVYLLHSTRFLLSNCKYSDVTSMWCSFVAWV